jgi:putative PIN family toxin of toxin-antitoxin system
VGTLGVVLDTNVLVSALGFGGPPLDVLSRTFDDEVRLLASAATLEELERVTHYDRLPFTEADRAQYLAILRREVDVVDPDSSVEVARDSDDDRFLDVALEGDADYPVSGDDDLLSLDTYEGTAVVTPDEFLTRVE